MNKKYFIKKLNNSKGRHVNDVLNSLSTEETVGLWDEYCIATGKKGDMIYNNNEHFFNKISSINSKYKTVYDIVKLVANGDYDSNKKYVCFDEYDELHSFDNLGDWDCPYFADDLLEWLVDKKTYIVSTKLTSHTYNKYKLLAESEEDAKQQVLAGNVEKSDYKPVVEDMEEVVINVEQEYYVSYKKQK
jgi:hypothetical protein